VEDDQFGGPEPDNAHLTGVILRLNDDGTSPTDNPFFAVGASMSDEVGANLQKIFAYGIRNTFGMAFDPKSGQLWLQENGDDSFDELRRVDAGLNGGWIQIMGPVSRISEFKAIETSPDFFGLQQLRWPPTFLADTPEEALARLFMLPGAHYRDSEFSWKYAVAPAGIGFVNGKGLGAQFDGDLFVGAARTNLANGYLFRFRLTGNGRDIVPIDPRLEDGVADNPAKFDITESESLLLGTDFGIGTDIQTGPNGNLFVVSLSNHAIYEIYRRLPSRQNN
jgi:glucose/arabinose dehydrogenase